MAITLKDIAERTGVSPSVVSTVLSGRDNGTFVSENTRQKVLQVAELLNYTPVRSGRPRGSRRLRRQRAEQFIGIWDAEYSPDAAFSIQNLQTSLRRYVEEHGAEAEDDFGLRLLTSEDLPKLDAIGIMGLVLLSPTLLPREAAAATIPSVMLGEVDNAPRELVQIHGDNVEAGHLLGNYLWDLGHRRVAFLMRGNHAAISRQRLLGLEETWAVQGGSKSDINAVPYDTMKLLSERDQVRRATLSLFGPESDAQNRSTVLICYDENVAAIAAQTLAEIGLHIPADVSLAGFNDTPRLAEALIPPLTTVRQPVAELAASAISYLYLLHDSEHPDEVQPRDVTLPVELVIRASCAPPSGS